MLLLRRAVHIDGIELLWINVCLLLVLVLGEATPCTPRSRSRQLGLIVLAVLGQQILAALVILTLLLLRPVWLFDLPEVQRTGQLIASMPLVLLALSRSRWFVTSAPVPRAAAAATPVSGT
jgi:hypothetical protein